MTTCEMAIPYFWPIIGSLIFGIVLADMAIRHVEFKATDLGVGIKSTLKPLAWLFIVLFWPILLSIAIVTVLTRSIRK